MHITSNWIFLYINRCSPSSASTTKTTTMEGEQVIENERIVFQDNENSEDKTGKEQLWSWLNNFLKIKMTDGRVLMGSFFCTDRDSNVILGGSVEYLNEDDIGVEHPRTLGLVMVPGRHIISVHYSKGHVVV